MENVARERLIAAIDAASEAEAAPLLAALAPHVGYVKIGLELITALGVPAAVALGKKHGGRLFLDVKLHDIPNTMAGAVRSIATLGVDLFTVHASAGKDAIRAAAAVKGSAKMLAVTVLTSLSDEDSLRIYGANAETKAFALAQEALDAGADGLVCSAKEVAKLAPLARTKGALLVTPGIRPLWAEAQDQKRVATPMDAILSGSTHLVVGRPLTKPPQSVGSPAEAARLVVEEIAKALAAGAKP